MIRSDSGKDDDFDNLKPTLIDFFWPLDVQTNCKHNTDILSSCGNV